MRKTRLFDHVTMNVYWFAISYLWNSMGPIILPNIIGPPLVAESVKGSALGLLSSVGLLVAIVVQPVAGFVSDRSTSRYGRRRPFILVGTVLDLVFLLAIGLARSYWFLFLAYFLLQFSSNVAHGPYQGLIPDRVPDESRGAASGVKQFAEILGIIVTSLVTADLMGHGHTLLALVVIMAVLMATMLLTVFSIQETPVPASGSRPLRETIASTFRVDLRSYPDYFWMLLSRLLIVTGMNLVRNYALYFVADVIIGPGVPYAQRVSQANEMTGSLLAILAVAIALTAVPTGVLADRTSKKLLVIISGVLGAIGAFLMIFARGRALLSLGSFVITDILVFGGIVGLSAGIFLSANWALATELIPRQESARYLGISNLATAGAGVIAGLGGPIRDFMGYAALFLSACICYIVGTVVLVKVGHSGIHSLQ